MQFSSIRYTSQKKKLAALSVLHMAQEIVSRHKHNMLSLLYATCLKLLVFFHLIFSSSFCSLQDCHFK